jgi:hypothetical protein
MRLSRLVLAAVVSLRAVLVYGEATGGADAELTWRDLLPSRWRHAGARMAGVRATAAPAPGAPAVAGRSA